MTRDPGHARPFFRVLAVVPALGGWLMVCLFIADVDWSHIGEADAWHVVAALSVALFFSLVAFRGAVPKWVLRLSPVDFGPFGEGREEEEPPEADGLPPEPPSVERDLVKFALSAVTLSATMFCLAYFTVTTGDWKRGVSGTWRV